MLLIITLTILILVINIYFSLHAIRTGNKKWIILIFIFPVAGFLMYFIYEYRNDILVKQEIDNFAKNFLYHKKHQKIYSVLLPIFYPAICFLYLLSTNKKENEHILIKAKKFLDTGRYNRAIPLFQACYLENSERVEVLKGLSICYFYRRNFFYKRKSDFTKVKQYIMEYKKIRKEYFDKFAMLLLARTFENLGDFDEAQKTYIDLMDYQTFIEAKYRYALFLTKNGDHNTALELFKNIIDYKNHCSAEILIENKKWLIVAANKVESMEEGGRNMS